MRIDGATIELPPKTHGRDNTGLRNRLAGHQVEEPSLMELQGEIRARVDGPHGRGPVAKR